MSAPEENAMRLGWSVAAAAAVVVATLLEVETVDVTAVLPLDDSGGGGVASFFPQETITTAARQRETIRLRIPAILSTVSEDYADPLRSVLQPGNAVPRQRYMLRISMRAALLLLLALPAGGATSTEVALLRDGSFVPKGEVCRFPARDRENPFKRWLTSQEVTCVASGTMTFPPGQWNVFGRIGGSAVSATPVLIDGAAAPQSLSLTVVPAATLSPLLQEASTGVVYAPRLGAAFPVARGSHVLVPAGEELWLIIVKKSLPAAIIPVPALDAGSERVIQSLGGGSFVIGWLQVPASDRDAVSTANGLSPPHVRLRSGGPSRDSYPLPPFSLLNGAFVLIRADSAGEAELALEGRGWIPGQRRVKVAEAVTVAAEPLLIRPGCSLVVNWSAEPGVQALERSLGSCNSSKEQTPQFEVSVSACPAAPKPGESFDPANCQPLRKESFGPDLKFGVMTLDDIPSGNYHAELTFGRLPPVSAMVTTVPAKQVSVPLHAAYFGLFGSLTKGDAPLGKDASLQFRGGGIGFAPMETGEYHAALPAPIDTDSPIDVASCDGAIKAIVLAGRPSTRSSRFDVNIPDNDLIVTITDTFTRAPIAGATLHYVVMSKAVPRRPVSSRVMTTPSDGTIEITGVPERELRLSVTQRGYLKYDVDPFSMLKSGKKNVDVQLVPINGNSGRLVSQHPFENATIFWFSYSGIETEHADVGPDGTFIYASTHTPDETMAVVSLSHPLWVRHSPDTRSGTRGQSFEVRFPDGAVRALEVSKGSANPHTVTFIGLVINGVIVPPSALRLHQTIRRLPATLSDLTPLPIRDLAETGPIDVILGPTVREIAVGAVSDVMLLERFSTAPHKRLGPGAKEVEFN